MSGKQVFLAGAVAAVLLCASQTQAQDYAFQGFATADAMNQMHAAMRDNMMEPSSQARAPARGGVAAGAAASGRRAAASASARTTYQSSPAITQRVKRQFADFVRSTGGDGAGIAAAMDQQDFFARWGQHVSQYGLRRGDVADAMTAYWMLNWQIANDVRSVSRAQVQSVQSQVRAMMGDNRSFTGLNDAQKQEMAEVLILNFIAQSVAYEDAMRDNDATMQRRLQNAATTRFQNEMNVDLRQLRLTGNGFVAAS